MFFVRTPRENGEDMIGSALSLLWMVVHSVQGTYIFYKKKEQKMASKSKFVTHYIFAIQIFDVNLNYLILQNSLFEIVKFYDIRLEMDL